MVVFELIHEYLIPCQFFSPFQCCKPKALNINQYYTPYACLSNANLVSGLISAISSVSRILHILCLSSNPHSSLSIPLPSFKGEKVFIYFYLNPSHLVAPNNSPSWIWFTQWRIWCGSMRSVVMYYWICNGYFISWTLKSQEVRRVNLYGLINQYCLLLKS